jgi:hypothetical protein
MTWCSFKDTTNGLGCDVAPPLGFKYSKRESNTNGHHPHKSKNTNDHFHLVACSQWMEEDIKPNITTSLLEDQIVESCVSLWRPITHIQTIPRTARTRGTTLWYQTGQCCNKTTSSQPIVASLIGRMMTAGASTQAWAFTLLL